MDQSSSTEDDNGMNLDARYRQVVMGFVGVLLWLAMFDKREANLDDLNSLMPLLFLAIPIAALARAALHRIKEMRDLGPALVTVIGMALLLGAHHIQLV